MDYKRKVYNRIAAVVENTTTADKIEPITNAILDEAFYKYDEFKNDIIELHSICIIIILYQIS